MDFWTVKQKVKSQYSTLSQWHDDLIQAIQDECNFNSKQAQFIFADAESKFDDIDNISDFCQKTSYNYRNFINLNSNNQ